jgi:hypothetical protein
MFLPVCPDTQIGKLLTVYTLTISHNIWFMHKIWVIELLLSDISMHTSLKRRHFTILFLNIKLAFTFKTKDKPQGKTKHYDQNNN